MPKISFVMPTKNRGQIIEKAIKSIIDQTIKDWELIIVDDHGDADDKTEQIVKSFNDERLKYYRMPENWSGGIVEARNFGNQLASAPVIAVADSDDINKPERAKLIVEAFECENCDVFYSQIEIYNEATGNLTDRRAGKYPVRKFDLKDMKEYNPIPHGSVAYKTELVLDFPYNSFFKISEDYDLLTRLAKAGKKFYFCDQVTYRYIVHESNITKENIPGNFGKMIKMNRGWVDDTERVEILNKMLSMK